MSGRVVVDHLGEIAHVKALTAGGAGLEMIRLVLRGRAGYSLADDAELVDGTMVACRKFSSPRRWRTFTRIPGLTH